jgi:hypothetical protein
MATTIFQNVIQKAGAGAQNSLEARNWLRQKAAEVRTVNPKATIQQGPVLTNRISPGNMYLFAYDPKTKEDLPYYDRFPLVFPFRKVQDGFYGINMHYLPPILRAKLMDALYDTVNNDKMDETTRLRINYRILQSAAKFRYFEPCVKHYLNNHVKTRFLMVDPKQWDVALFLPLERFAKASKSKVYADSIKRSINNGR